MLGISSGSAKTVFCSRAAIGFAEEEGKEVREVRRRDRLEGKRRNVLDVLDQKGEGFDPECTTLEEKGCPCAARLETRAPYPPVLQVENRFTAAAPSQSAGCFGSNQNQSCSKIRIKSWNSVYWHKKRLKIGQNDFMKVRVIWSFHRMSPNGPRGLSLPSFPCQSSKQKRKLAETNDEDHMPPVLNATWSGRCSDGPMPMRCRCWCWHHQKTTCSEYSGFWNAEFW